MDFPGGGGETLVGQGFQPYDTSVCQSYQQKRGIKKLKSTIGGVLAGFTLAETLITLAIVGVVAAITIPIMITKYQKNQTVIRLKKTYNDILNVHNRAINDYDNPSTWEYPRQYNKSDTKIFLEKYYLPYLKNAKFVSADDIVNKYNYIVKNTLNQTTIDPTGSIILSDGRLISFYARGNYLLIAADINGFGKPNRAGRDVFILHQYCKEGDCIVGYTPKFPRGFCDKSTNYLYNGWNCGMVIQDNGWKIPDGYPW